jgi:hypothetical protein
VSKGLFYFWKTKLIAGSKFLRSGKTRTPDKSAASASSPKAILEANLGIEIIVGRDKTFPQFTIL